MVTENNITISYSLTLRIHKLKVILFFIYATVITSLNFLTESFLLVWINDWKRDILKKSYYVLITLLILKTIEHF